MIEILNTIIRTTNAQCNNRNPSSGKEVYLVTLVISKMASTCLSVRVMEDHGFPPSSINVPLSWDIFSYFIISLYIQFKKKKKSTQYQLYIRTLLTLICKKKQKNTLECLIKDLRNKRWVQIKSLHLKTGSGHEMNRDSCDVCEVDMQQCLWRSMIQCVIRLSQRGNRLLSKCIHSNLFSQKWRLLWSWPRFLYLHPFSSFSEEDKWVNEWLWSTTWWLKPVLIFDVVVLKLSVKGSSWTWRAVINTPPRWDSNPQTPQLYSGHIKNAARFLLSETLYCIQRELRWSQRWALCLSYSDRSTSFLSCPWKASAASTHPEHHTASSDLLENANCFNIWF